MTTSPLTNGHMPRRRVLIAAATAAAAAVCSFAALGQTASSAKQERLRILCTGPAGSVPDIIARSFGEALVGVFAQQVVVDNRPGAAGQIAVQALKSAPADGSTWLLGQGAIASLYPTLYRKLGYDPARDLVPVSLAAEMNLGVAVGNAVPAEVTDTRMLVEWMRRHPGEANAASPGTGTLPHILEVMLFDQAGLDWRHVPYPGGPPAMAALLGGQVAVLVLPEGLLLPQLATDRLRMLGTSGLERSRFSPAVPTLAEQGHARSVMREWFAFFAPAGTPASVAEQASEAVGNVVARAGLARRFGDAAMVVAHSSPKELTAKVEDDRRAWGPLLVNAGIRGDA
ncbi:tripartite tricarboxylate transporter substrate-binding protein [Variovorax sp. J22R24]|uniref:tripartite tricarboxylate transporter substrate-binding protein n=1 Tax=Variovorax gracilis TaxID=3053502 RepID=UPI002578CCA2|nr:tripartite tricarboxylate transporter substrate-binding protein [Variovorax sp. J22R24]MDM0109981.1 tripartite tricarboxylate transporter substrate-binding protein [Variovorax sp. J22R24]